MSSHDVEFSGQSPSVFDEAEGAGSFPIAGPGALEAVCIIGMGYVGLTLAVAMADAGYRVYGVERCAHIRDCIASGRAHFSEAGLDVALARHVRNQRISCSAQLPAPGVASSFIITVGTPLDADGVVNLGSLVEVLHGVASVIQDGDAVILRSTVKAGTTRGIAASVLAVSGKRFDLAFCPERTLEGKALKELTALPQIVGGLNSRSVERAASIFSVFAPRIIRVESLEAAEMIKLINNTHRDLMFAFSNEIAQMCDAIGVSAMQVIHAACDDYPRSQIALPGPVGGPCLEKDPHILAEGLREVGYIPRISLAGRRLNEELPAASMERLARKLHELGMSEMNGAKVVILGLAFKGRPETNDLRGTMAAPILKAARARWPGASFHAYDPVVAHEHFAGFDVAPCVTLEAAFKDASLVLIQNNHVDFARMPLQELARTMANPALVYDYWNMFAGDDLVMPGNRVYGGLGCLPLGRREGDGLEERQVRNRRFPTASESELVQSVV